jgi:hypothetical protein
MINASTAGDEVWVAAGTYKPTTTTDRNISFSMKNGVGIYGGFNGTETQLSQRNWWTNVTTLSGDIGISGNNSDNSYSVIVNEGISSAIFDGFTVTQANSTPPTGEILGGGIYNAGSSPTIRNCIFSNNTGSYAHAGIFNFNDGTPTIINCLFINNVGTVYSSGVFNFGGSANIINCTFYGNHTAISNQGGNALSVRNCILWGNNNQFNLLAPHPTTSTVANSIVQGGWSGTGNLNTDPLFVNAAGGDFRLQACSPAIDAGNDSANNTSTDLGGSPRKTDVYLGGAQIDIGAYEALSGDTQAPSITCPANIPCVEATSPSGAVVFYPSPTAIDNCDGNVPVNAVLPSGSIFALGLNTVVASASDSKGNSASCTFTIQVCDRTPPTIHNMPNNISCVAATSPAGAVVTYVNPTATDIVDVPVSVTCSPASGSVFPIGSTTVMCTAIDAAGNAASSSFVVSVDGTPPTITCPATQTLVLGANCSATLPNYTILATTADNCGVQGVTQSPAAGTTVFSAGNMTVTLTVTDVNGNQTECTFTVTKVDNTPPTITCPATQTVAANAMGNYTLANFTGSATVLDNCTASPTVTQLPTAGSTLGVGQHTIALTATDESANTAGCSFTLVVQALDCAGTPDGTAFLDNCNTCVGGNTGLTACVQDCNGDYGGAASIDQCGVCSGGNTGLVPNASCLDCEGVPNGLAQPGTACDDGDATTIDDTWTNDCQCIGTQTYVLSGNIIWEHDLNTPVAAATVTLSGDDAGSDDTDASGDYELETTGGNLTVTPTKNDNPRQGVDAADAARIRQHALGTLPFNDGYKVIAADVNESNSVTSVDAVIVQQALLGNAGAGNLLDNPAWRFVEAAHIFANENAPWGFPSNVALTGVAEAIPDVDFVGVKMGDVNGSGLGNIALTSQPATWLLPDAALEAGSTHRVAFALGESLPDVAAWQFALRLDPAYATVSRITPKAALPLTREDFGTENLLDGELRTVFAQAQGQPLKAGEVVFELELTVRQGGVRLSEILTLDNDILDGRVYDTALKGGVVKLAFAPVRDKPGLPTVPTYAEAAFELYQNVPNPFADETIIAFSLPTDVAATITVHDASGRVVAQLSGDYAAGYNTVRLTRDALKGATGILTYTVTVGTYTATRRMLVVK